jgi:hypothetical protein
MPDRHICAVCVSPMIATVHSMQECGASWIEIADATSLQADEIEKHFAECCEVATASEPDSLAASDARLKQLQERIALVATAGGLQGDLRSQVSALSLSLRAELEVRASLQERAEAIQPLTPDCRSWPEEKRREFIKYTDSVMAEAEARAKPGSAVADYGWLCRLEPETLALFKRIAVDPQWLAAAKALEKTANVAN